MKARILDDTSLGAISPRSLYAYLTAQGWAHAGAFGHKGDFYSLEGAPRVVVPATADFADYSEIVSQVIKVVAKAEERSELSVYRDLTVADIDLIRVRAPEAQDDGSITVEAGVEFVQQSRDLLLAAACSAAKPQRAYRAGKNKEANDYLKDVRLGQTEHGSFVLTLISPVPPSLTGQGTFWPEMAEETFNRKVTRTLSTALGAIKEAVALTNRGRGIDAFEERVRLGVSANLCDATAKLITDGNGLDVSLTWALTRPAPSRRAEYKFSRSEAETLKEAAKVLREREPIPDEQVIGFVTALARENEASQGRATIKAPVEDKLSSVRVDFGPEQYGAIVEAHRDRRPVSLQGDLEREGQRWRLRNPRDLEILPKDPDEAVD